MYNFKVSFVFEDGDGLSINVHCVDAFHASFIAISTCNPTYAFASPIVEIIVKRVDTED